MTAELISRTGRVQSWLDNPESRLPVSCTVFVVEDSMEGENGIEASWRYVSHGLRFGAGVAVHLSTLRPKGAENGRGLTASGPVSFAKIYSQLNETLRRGGVYKNGAVVIHLDILVHHLHQVWINYLSEQGLGLHRDSSPYFQRTDSIHILNQQALLMFLLEHSYHA